MKRALIRIRARQRKEDKVSLTGKERSAIERRVADKETHDVVALPQVITVQLQEVKVSLKSLPTHFVL